MKNKCSQRASKENLSGAIDEVLSQCETNEDRLGGILDSEAVHICAANKHLTFIKVILSLLAEPQRQTNIVLNHLDGDCFTPLMTYVRHIDSNDLEDSIRVIKTHQFVESIISLGADKNIIHAKTGFSALGHFRENEPKFQTWKVEARMIKQILNFNTRRRRNASR